LTVPGGYHERLEKKVMGVRESLNKKQSLSIGMAVAFLICAAGIIIISRWPEHRFSGKTVFYTDDDGQSWYVGSLFQTPPIDRNGKQTVRAVVYSCDNGNKKICAYLIRYLASDKKRIDNAVADAAKNGKPPSSVALFYDKGIMNEMEVKQPGLGHAWVSIGNSAGLDVENAVLQQYANDTTVDIVDAE
jgi:hypothetical protein